MTNLVVYCDGTGNETGFLATNIVRLQRIAPDFDPDQKVYYEPGVGTKDKPDPWHELAQETDLGLALATGAGLDTKVIRAYEFLVENYRDGDHIFLFGFSRGAYAARILAAMIYKIGLLPQNAKHMAGSGLSKFEEFSRSHGWDEDATEEEHKVHNTGARLFSPHERIYGDYVLDDAYLFARQLGSRWITIDFVGVWDTVASLIRPNPDKFLIPDLTHLKFTRRNPIVKTFRHAMAIDERRRMFPLDPWVEPQTCFRRPSRQLTFGSELFDWLLGEAETSRSAQDIAQVWFAGVHADVGGGYREEISGLSKFSLIWMVEEAVKAGLIIDRAVYDRLAWGKNLKDILHIPPTFALPQENMNALWSSLERFPKLDKYKKLYIPNAERRRIPEGALIHESVFGCMNAFQTYHPSNLPKNYRKVGHPDPG
ncbi:DUF2235 domain-containing protein [Microvirga massiliensis]|uniref:DUF2235 domain-containing protein n=1 Tax=Microvirga massiliensis TaxID=1033741 RepID=UPI00062B513F|nr:DUF2235 domain-containing protein [Microvirga massiliensis]